LLQQKRSRESWGDGWVHDCSAKSKRRSDYVVDV